jgi:phosphoribosylformylglycinamidine cyclo-ligase
MPGFYPEGEYDLAGFSVGIVDKKRIIDGSTVKDGDAVIGLASSGVHSNGFSLVRKVLGVSKETLAVHYDELGCTLGEELIKPTKIYVKALQHLEKSVKIKAVSHITGGGFYENIPRMLPAGIRIKIDSQAFPVLPIFNLIQKAGGISTRDMFNTFNMGIGLVIAIDSSDAGKAMHVLEEAGERPYLIGTCVTGETGIEL